MARRIDFFDGAESSTAPTIGNIDSSNLVSYADDAAYEAANAGSPVLGNIYANSTTNMIRWYDGSAWRNVTDEPIDAAQIADGSVSNTEFQYLANVTSDIQAQIDASGSDLSDHLSDPTDAHDASAISNVPSGNLVATDVQTALNELQTDVDSRILTADKGQPNGVASLDGSGKVPVTQLPNSIMEYQGTWNASTNTPTLTNGVGNTGDVYRAFGSGSVDFGAGSISFAAGDYVIYNGSQWEKADMTDGVVSVNGFTGAVNLNLTDIADVNTASLSARYLLRRNVANTEYETYNQWSSDTDTTTGSNATLAAVNTWVVQLLTAGLNSVDMIPAGYSNQTFILTNKKGSNLTINNETGATAANRILTGTGANITVPSNSSIYLTYDAASSRWRVVGSAPSLTSGSTTSVAYILDEKSAGVQGGTFTAGAWVTRTINVLTGDTSFISIGANRFTLAPGTYHVDISCPAQAVNQHVTKLVQDPGGTPTDVKFGEPMYASNLDNVNNRSAIKTRLVLASSTTFEVQHRCVTTKTTDGLGVATGLTVETYLNGVIMKLA